MNKRVKELWLEWLENNKQTTGCLYNVNEGAYCCLGGLTQCYINETGKTWDEVEGKPIENEYGWNACLPYEVANWAGVVGRDPTLKVDGEQVNITYLNDDCEYTFKQLAELIKDQF